MKKSLAVLVALAALLAVSCKKKEPAAAKPAGTDTSTMMKAGGKLEPKSGSKVTGTVTFMWTAERKMVATVSVENAAPGLHGVHVHEKGDCSAPDASSAGGHLNPAMQKHGGPMVPNHHLGDLGNLTVGPDGKGTMTVSLTGFAPDDGPNGVINKSVVVHEKEDDLKTDPSGNSGARIACAVIHKE